MSDGYLGEIRMFAGSFAPVNWMLCNGQMLAPSDNEALYALIGAAYGGDAVNTFALPDLRGRVAVSTGQSLGSPNVSLAERGGAESVSLTPSQLPQHTHSLQVSTAVGDVDTPAATSVLAAAGPTGTGLTPYANAGDGTQAASSPTSTTLAGRSQPHFNMQPYLAINFIICVAGVYPPRP